MGAFVLDPSVENPPFLKSMVVADTLDRCHPQLSKGENKNPAPELVGVE